MRQLSDYDRRLLAAREHIAAGRFLEANEELEHIEPLEMRATIPVFILRERIYHALGNVEGADRIAATLDRLRAYAERESIERPSEGS